MHREVHIACGLEVETYYIAPHPLVRELGTGVVIGADTSDVGIHDVVIHVDILHISP